MGHQYPGLHVSSHHNPPPTPYLGANQNPGTNLLTLQHTHQGPPTGGIQHIDSYHQHTQTIAQTQDTTRSNHKSTHQTSKNQTQHNNT